MERQTVYTSAARLNPFWTLVLQITSGKTSQSAPALPCAAGQEAGASSPIDERREFQAISGPVSQPGGTSEAYRLPARPTNLGPFMTLILSMHRHRSKSDASGYPAVPLRLGVIG